MTEEDKLLKNYAKSLEYLDALIFLTKHRVPFEEWPSELQGISGISQELMGEEKDE